MVLVRDVWRGILDSVTIQTAIFIGRVNRLILKDIHERSSFTCDYELVFAAEYIAA